MESNGQDALPLRKALYRYTNRKAFAFHVDLKSYSGP